MATIKVNDTSYFMSTDKITTPSLIIHDAGYVPLFRGNINSTVDYDGWRYTLGALKVGDYRAAVSRTSSINPEDDPGVPTGDVVLLGTMREQAKYLVGQTYNFVPWEDTAHNRKIGSPILYPAGTDYHHVSETRYRITNVNNSGLNAATVSGVKLKFNSPDTGEWFIGFDKYGGVDGNTYNSTALAPIPYTIGSNITTPVATFKVTRVVELPSGARAVYGTHVSGIVS